ncbi:MAG: tRNA (adenosine(37)-N6)-threonylcarbamoyltransferase complex ATPase subunit type 1 TsaE [Coriobacteriia bacterium]|nr:tRNA (adenosine(37)-N6)-threonylcarbamoyltransferase complex ATPase subunit type 1 TsaE [Coriobacteriia bacterium]
MSPLHSLPHIESSSAAQTIDVGHELGKCLQPGDVIILSGDLGAGKTKLASALAQGLGITESVTSPTFAIMKQYTAGRIPLNHLDLYRLDAAEQLDDLDFWDIVAPDAGEVVLIEWGDMFKKVVACADLQVVLQITGTDSRTIELLSLSERGTELATQVQSRLQQ